MKDFLRLQTFEPHLNTEFSVRRGAEWVPATLAEAKANGKPGHDGGEKFSLVFATGPEKPLEQGVHEFQHPALGAHELFITPVMCPHRDLRWYEAVINREAGL